MPPTFGCLAATLAGRPHSLSRLGFDVARSFHGEETIRVAAPLRVGAVLYAQQSMVLLPDVRGARGGLMRRALRRTVLTDESGQRIATTTRTLLEADRVLTGSQPIGDVSVFDDGLGSRIDPVPHRPMPPARLPVGTALPSGVFGALTRTDFVRYAAASGDLTAIHFDENAARSRGYRTVFGMGMLSAAFIGHMITDWVDLVHPWELRIRFRDQVWPGDTLRIDGVVSESSTSSFGATVMCTVGERVITSATLVMGSAA